MQEKIFYISCFGIVFGILLSSFVFINLYLTILILLTSFGIVSYLKLISTNSSLNRNLVLVSIFVFTFSLGIARFQMTNHQSLLTFDSHVNQEVSLEGNIIDEPNIGIASQKIIVEIKKEKEKTKILLSANLNEELRYGDKIRLKGKLEMPDNFMTDQGKEFDYINYLRKDGISYIMRYPKIEILSHNNGNPVKNSLFIIKENFINKLNLVIREPESLLMGGLILGEKSSFDESLRQSFVNTGTIHMVALSGYNVTIISEWIMKLFSSFPRNIGISIGMISIFLFVLMTGGSSTAIRAGVMAGLALFARLLGRNYDIARALAFAAVVMILANPLILVFDVSFQLSFIATFAVIFFSPKIEKYFLWITPRFGLRDMTTVTTAAYIFVLPFILYKMGNLSLVALPANVFVLPFIPLTMSLGFFSGIAGMIWYQISVPFGLISFALLHYELTIINFFSSIPFSSISIPDFPVIFTILIYVFIIYKFYWRNIKDFFKEKQNTSNAIIQTLDV